jgi:hypothetical protein
MERNGTPRSHEQRGIQQTTRPGMYRGGLADWPAEAFAEEHVAVRHTASDLAEWRGRWPSHRSSSRSRRFLLPGRAAHFAGFLAPAGRSGSQPLPPAQAHRPALAPGSFPAPLPSVRPGAVLRERTDPFRPDKNSPVFSWRRDGGDATLETPAVCARRAAWA